MNVEANRCGTDAKSPQHATLLDILIFIFFFLKYFTCIHKRKTTLKTVMAKLAWTTVISSHERWLSTILAYRVKSLLHIIHV